MAEQTALLAYKESMWSPRVLVPYLSATPMNAPIK